MFCNSFYKRTFKRHLYIWEKERDIGRGTLIFYWLTFCAIVTVEGDEKKPKSWLVLPVVFGHSSAMWSTDMLAIVVNKNLWLSEKETFEDLILYLVREIWGKIEKMGEKIGEKIIFLIIWLGEKMGEKTGRAQVFSLATKNTISPNWGQMWKRKWKHKSD